MMIIHSFTETYSEPKDKPESSESVGSVLASVTLKHFLITFDHYFIFPYLHVQSDRSITSLSPY